MYSSRSPPVTTNSRHQNQVEFNRINDRKGPQAQTSLYFKALIVIILISGFANHVSRDDRNAKIVLIKLMINKYNYIIFNF
jgi:hypothetical protein